MRDIQAEQFADLVRVLEAAGGRWQWVRPHAQGQGERRSTGAARSPRVYDKTEHIDGSEAL
jgi:hypothetical protein